MCGDVKYGEQWFTVNTEGTIVDIHKRGLLITLDNIDGDGLATCYVSNKCVSEIDDGEGL